ncbi:MAG TPA: family 10 glycosylhydrolase [Candidatus Hydrogenedentes bacterium]|nr:family 10 glycosylhydrolase [Candidatus Hydrogenedentota bacterium]HQM48137.1 family 10 glycosylhydrolase [Candidatus Hydrogenedentota bacterium]
METGSYRRYFDIRQSTDKQEVVLTMICAHIGMIAVYWMAAGLSAAAENGQGLRLVAEFDCAKEYPPEAYFGHGAVSVVESSIGPYREAEGRPLSRFGYRFKVENTGRPHLAVIRYPDDKRRFMCVMDGTCYDLTTGVYTGFENPLSGKMLEIRRIFWPRWTDCSIVFMTWSDGEPAAVADIKVYEMDGLAPLDVPGDPGDGSRRELGIQFEDPCGTCASVGAMSNAEWIDRMAAYARHSGQNLLVYPIVWYHGPLYPSEREPAGNFNTVVAPDRKQYARWTSQPADWVAEILERFDKEGLDFQAAVTLLRLGTLMKSMNIDLESIKAGKDTINNMLGSGQVQAGTQDWTPLYNVMNFPDQVAGTSKGWAYGELSGQPYHAGPIFNPLHPVVQDAVVGLAAEIAERYKGHPSFKGISFNMWHATILWYASLDAGYDDYTVSLFSKETGIEVPVEPVAPDRFSKRHAFLTGERRKEWIDWRCAKIHELFCRIRDEVVARRPDLRVTITLWSETTVSQMLGFPKTPGHQLYARQSTIDLYRDGGFDIALFQNDPNIEVDLCFTPARDRDCWGTSGVNMTVEETSMFRDHDFLDKTTLKAAYAQETPGAYIFNSWVEAWGTHKWFPCEENDAQAKELAVMSGKPAEGIFRINSTYPEDGFWWDSQLRITPPLPGGDHFMEHYAHALAELDACRITRGGLFLDPVNTGQLQQFARAYRALPAKKFETVSASTDPVAVRSLTYNGRQYLYLVNREYYSVAVELALTDAAQATDLATQQAAGVQPQWPVTLGPYELRAFMLDNTAKVSGFAASAPDHIVARLKSDAEAALEQIARLRAANAQLPTGADRMEADIRAALEAGHYAWLRRALHSYIIRKCGQLSASLQ